MEGKGLGLQPVVDPQDEGYLLRATTRVQTISAIRSKRWVMFARPLDQGREGTCVGHGWKHWMMAAPWVSKASMEPSAVTIYKEALPHDPWPENDWGDLQSGTSLNAGAKALRARGLLTEWRHEFTVEGVRQWLAGVNAEGRFIGGPVVLGLPWFTSMWDTDKNGFLSVSGSLAGYHCVAALQWNEKGGYFAGPNSWGNKFGKPRKDGTQDGWWRITGENMEKLFQHYGHAVTSLERRPAKALP